MHTFDAAFSVPHLVAYVVAQTFVSYVLGQRIGDHRVVLALRENVLKVVLDVSDTWIRGFLF